MAQGACWFDGERNPDGSENWGQAAIFRQMIHLTAQVWYRKMVPVPQFSHMSHMSYTTYMSYRKPSYCVFASLR